MPFLDVIAPHLLHAARQAEPGLRESLRQQLAALVVTARRHLRPWARALFELACDYYEPHLEQAMPLIEAIAVHAMSRVRFAEQFAPRLPPLLLARLSLTHVFKMSKMAVVNTGGADLCRLTHASRSAS